MSATNHDEIASNFVNFYYRTFATNRTALSSLYHPHSMLTMEGAACQGPDAILAKLTTLPTLSPTAPFSLETLDAQPSNAEGGVIIFVTGKLMVEGEEMGLRFSQTFQLMPGQGGSYYVLNDIFRLNYG
jgi:hypothetical protein